MKKLLSFLLAAALALGVCAPALAVDESVTGEVAIYSSMYQFVLDMLDDALKAEFPNLTPGCGGSFFRYGGSSALINSIYQQMTAKGWYQTDTAPQQKVQQTRQKFSPSC